MGSYLKICPSCGERYDGNTEYCDNCGNVIPEKSESLGVINSIAEEISNKYFNFYNSDLIVSIILHIAILQISIFLIPPFIRDSYVFAAIIIYLTIVSLLKKLGQIISFWKYLIIIIKIIAFTQLGTGIAILISSTGFSRFPSFSHHFYFATIYSEIMTNSPYFLIFGFGFTISVFSISKLYRSLVQ